MDCPAILDACYICLLFSPNLPNPFLQSMIQSEAGANARSQTRVQPRDYHHHTVRTRMVHIFIRVCALIYNGILPSTFTRHLGKQYLPQTAEVIPCLLAPPPRCSRHQAEAQMHGPDCLSRVACGRNKRIDQCQPQSAGGARTSMQD